MAEKIQKVEKAKVAIVNGLGEILILTRSLHEDTRRGESDWPGGTLEPDEIADPIIGLRREVEKEELPGTRLDNITLLWEREKLKDGVPTVSHLYAATAEFPADGLVLSHEHSAASWVAPEDFPGLDIPNKYKKAVLVGRPIIESLAELQSYTELAA